MNGYSRGLALTALMVCTVVNSALANGFRNPPEGAAALGRSGAKITQVDDPSAVAINPANLAGARKMDAGAGVTLIQSSVEFRGSDGRRDETDDSIKAIPNVFGVVPLQGKGGWVFGIGLTSPWGQATEWPESGAVAGTAPYIAKLTTANLNPTLATRLGKKVRIGAGLDLLWGELDLRQQIALAPGAPLTHVRLKGDGEGLGGNAGVTIDLPRRQRVSAVYRSPIEIDFKGDTTVTGFTGPLAPASDFRTEIEFPAMVGVGYGIGVTPKFNVGVEVEWVEYSRFKSLPVNVGANAAAGVFPPEIPQRWEDAWTYGIGADYAWNKTWTLRAGCVYLETPIPEDTLAPTLPDDDRWVFSVGAGYRKSANRLDLAYAYSEYDRAVEANLNPAYLGTYKAEIHLAQISYARQF